MAPPRAATRELPRVFFALLMRHRLWVERAIAGFDLSVIQARTLFLMDPNRPATMSEVAKNAGCGPSNLTGIIDKLEARRLLRRRAATGDRRVKMVTMTREGAALRRRLIARLNQPAPWMSALSEDDQRQLAQILRRALAVEQPPDTAAE
jgi:DNA-binding MarR family transcriptional regulator